MPQISNPLLKKRQVLVQTIAAQLPPACVPEYLGSVPFGAVLRVERWRYPNGLTLLSCEDDCAPVFSYHSWVRVGSRHERPTKTGLAHLFEHLMFGETAELGQGDYDRLLEEAGAENNASTWLDFTQYTVNAPAGALSLVVKLEAERLAHLQLVDEPVAREKDVVANERRYRVDDDIEGATSELLWKTAFVRHPYRAPTIGWMEDIEGFTTEDCREFFKAYYAPNNLCLVVVGDFPLRKLLELVGKAYGELPSGELPVEDLWPELPQSEERRAELTKPTPTEKLTLGYHGPALGDAEHGAVNLLIEVLCAGRASRLVRRLVHDEELATDVRAFVGPFRDPGLIEISAVAREGVTAERLLASIDDELERIKREPVASDELERAQRRTELGLLAGLDTADGKASTLGFYETLLGRPAAAFERVENWQRLTPSDLLRAARRFFEPQQRTVVCVRSQQEANT